MRAHGVSKFPDPGSADGGVQLWVPQSIRSRPRSIGPERMSEAIPGGLPGLLGKSATRIAQGVRIAGASAPGLRSFLDPTTSPLSTLPAPNEMFLGGPNGFFSLSASMVQSPAFKRAAGKRHFPLPAWRLHNAGGGARRVRPRSRASQRAKRR